MLKNGGRGTFVKFPQTKLEDLGTPGSDTGFHKNSETVNSSGRKSVCFPPGQLNSCQRSTDDWVLDNSPAVKSKMLRTKKNSGSMFSFPRNSFNTSWISDIVFPCTALGQNHIFAPIYDIFSPITIRNSGKTTHRAFNHWLWKTVHGNNTISYNLAKLSRLTPGLFSSFFEFSVRCFCLSPCTC